MRRREFITFVGGAAAWPLVAGAQQAERTRRVGVLFGSDDASSRGRVELLREALRKLNWIDGQNIRLDVRQGAGDANAIRVAVAELVALKPDVIIASSGSVLGRLLEATRSVPIVFAAVPDPVGSGFVNSLSHPGGNATGFMQFEYGLTGKWLELLRELAPSIKRVAVIWDPDLPAGVGQFAIIQAVASALGIEITPFKFRDITETERGLAAFVHSGNGGLIVTAASVLANRELFIELTARVKLPAIYPNRRFVDLGGLMSYAADFDVQYRGAASYVDRILKGEKPTDMPVQAPNKYELIINLRTAKALGLTIPPALLARADEVIE